MDKSREEALSQGASMPTGGVNFNYVDTAVLDRLGIDRYNTKKPKGNNFIRIVVPSSVGPFALEVHKHDNIGSNTATYLCLNKMFGKSCPICEYAKELKRTGGSLEAVKALDTSRRFLMFVVDTENNDTIDEGPKWFDCPISIYKEICIQSQNRRTGERIDPTDPINGRDVEFVRRDGKRTEYIGLKLVETDPIPKSWYEDLPAFEDVLLIPTAEELEIAVRGSKSSDAISSNEGRDIDQNSRTRRNEDSSRTRRGGDGSRGRRERAEHKPESTESVEEESRSSRRSELASTDSKVTDAVNQKIEEIRNRRRNNNVE